MSRFPLGSYSQTSHATSITIERKSWNVSARHDTLWKAQYSLHCGDDLPSNALGRQCTNSALYDEEVIQHQRLQGSELRVVSSSDMPLKYEQHVHELSTVLFEEGMIV